MSVNLTAAKGFGKAADLYERTRPEYPDEVVEFLSEKFRLSPSSNVVDLAAGTGKFTRHLLFSGAKILAVEPVASMRSEFSKTLRNLDLIGGVAELLPLRDLCVNAVFVAQAFHWFKHERALSEIHRVLKPSAGLALIWNVRDDSVSWISKLNALSDSLAKENGIQKWDEGSWQDTFEKSGLFTALQEYHYHNAQNLSREALIERVLSISYVAILPDKSKAEFLKRFQKIIDEDPLTKGKDSIELPYQGYVYWCRKI